MPHLHSLAELLKSKCGCGGRETKTEGVKNMKCMFLILGDKLFVSCSSRRKQSGESESLPAHRHTPQTRAHAHSGLQRGFLFAHWT